MRAVRLLASMQRCVTDLRCRLIHKAWSLSFFYMVYDMTGSCRLVVERVDPKMDSLIYAKVNISCCDYCMIVFHSKIEEYTCGSYAP